MLSWRIALVVGRNWYVTIETRSVNIEFEFGSERDDGYCERGWKEM